MSLTNSPNWFSAPPSGFYSHTIGQSLRFEDGDNPYLSKTFSSSGGTIFTLSCWVKIADHKTSRTLLQGYSNSSNYSQIILYGGTAATDGWIGMYSAVGGSTKLYKYTSALFRDPTAWYHVVVKFNGTSGSEEFKIYVNGENQTLTTSTALTAHQSLIGNSNAQYIGNNFNQSLDMNGYLAEYHFIDGTALDADSFGETKAGIWIPKQYSGSYGTNGFYLDFADGSALGDDESGNANDFTASGLAATDVVLDSPTNNYCTMTPLPSDYISQITFAEGNLKCQNSTVHKSMWATFAITSGKWYWEADNAGGNKFTIGLSDANNTGYKQVAGTNNIVGYLPSGSYAYGDAVGLYAGIIFKNGSTVASSLGYATGDKMAIAFDADAGKLWFRRNGTWFNGSGTDSTTLDASNHDTTVTTGEAYVPVFSLETPSTWVVNFGQDSTFAGAETAGGNTDENGQGDFFYAVPSGFLALCSANLPDPAIDPAQDEEPADYFNTVLYTGNGSTQSITGVGFQPDWVWLKSRSSVYDHTVYDVIRGATYKLAPNDFYVESADTDTLTSFDSDGFSVGADVKVNASSGSMVSWNWLAGTSVSGSTGGAGTSKSYSGSVNTESGFSIIAYAGNGTSGHDIPHHLGVTPEMIIVKSRNYSYDWFVYHKDISTTNAWPPYIELNDTAAKIITTQAFEDPTSTNMGLYSNGAVNRNGGNHIAYLFASKDGYSKVGSYTGNGSSNGTFVYTGFRPAWIMTKRIDSTSSWVIVDNKRNTFNVVNKYLLPNGANAEATATISDFTSNGFKFRGGTHNDSGGSFIYLAFADQPAKFANAR